MNTFSFKNYKDNFKRKEPWGFVTRCVGYFVIIFLFFMAFALYCNDGLLLLKDVWPFFMLLAGMLLLIIWLERREIAKLSTAKRLKLRGLTGAIFVIFLFSAGNWPPVLHAGKVAVQLIQTEANLTSNHNASQKLQIKSGNIFDNNDKTVIFLPFGGQGSGGYLGWALTVIALVIGFVVNLLYRIAQDAKEQVESVRKILDLDGKVAESKLNLVQMEVIVNGMSLLAEISPKKAKTELSAKNMKAVLSMLPTRINMMQSLLEPICEIKKVEYELQKFEAELSVQISKIKNERFYFFLQTNLTPYLEALHERLCQSRIAERDDGMACITSIEKICELVRLAKPKK